MRDETTGSAKDHEEEGSNYKRTLSELEHWKSCLSPSSFLSSNELPNQLSPLVVLEDFWEENLVVVQHQTKRLISESVGLE